MSAGEGVNGRAPARASKGAKSSGAREFFAIIGLVLLVWASARTLLFQPFNIPSSSLVPTLLTGDYLFVSKYAYGYSHYSLPDLLDPTPEVTPGSRDLRLGFVKIPSLASMLALLHAPPLPAPGRILATPPKRGDIVVFKLPSDGATDYIKRLIGLPGDTIQLRHGRLFINGTIVERTPLPPYSTPDHFGSLAAVPHYLETLPNGVSHEIIQVDGDEGYWDNTAVYEVPPDNYFMMGDNRDNSSDSRLSAQQGGVGYVPFENLVGRAEVIFFSRAAAQPEGEEAGWPGLVRWRRLFQPVR
jgi:signal peptidase I